MNFPIVLLACSLLTMSAACAAPTVINDLSGLGSGELAKTLSNSIFLNEITTNRAVERLVNRPDLSEIQDKTKWLEALGFKCGTVEPIKCSYSGFARSIFTPEKGNHSASVTNVTLDATIGSEKIVIRSVIKRSMENRID